MLTRLLQGLIVLAGLALFGGLPDALTPQAAAGVKKVRRAVTKDIRAINRVQRLNGHSKKYVSGQEAFLKRVRKQLRK